MKILLVCSAGTSTSMVVKKMNEVAEAEGKDYKILAVSSTEGKEIAMNYDVMLIGPQLKFQMASLKEQFPELPIDAIPPVMYGRLDGKGVIELAENLYNKSLEK